MFSKNKQNFNPLILVSLFIILIGLAFFLSGITLILSILFLVVLVSYPLLVKLAEHYYKLKDISDEIIFAKTKDGWNLSLHIHYTQNPIKDAYPVIIAHGIMANKFSVDMDYSNNLAYYLKQKGYTVFAINLRGVGLSFHNSKSKFRDFNFDDIVEQDIPTLIKKVCDHTGASKVNWIGHSMGAMIMQAYLARNLSEKDKVASFISIAGPGNLNHLRKMQSFNFITRHQNKVIKVLDLSLGAKLLSLFGGSIQTPIDEFFYVKENIDTKVLRYFLCNAAENIAPGLAEQFSRWIINGKECTLDGQFDYSKNYNNITTPSLFLAGSKDRIAIPECVSYVYENVSSKNKKYILFSKENGYSLDYCHLSLVLGKNVRKDVYPSILKWLGKYGKENTKIVDFRVIKNFIQNLTSSKV